MIVTLKLTEVEARHIQSLILNNEHYGNYHGNEKNYWDRSERIKVKIFKELCEPYDKNSML
jgi:hypothetical protein